MPFEFPDFPTKEDFVKAFDLIQKDHDKRAPFSSRAGGFISEKELSDTFLKIRLLTAADPDVWPTIYLIHGACSASPKGYFLKSMFLNKYPHYAGSFAKIFEKLEDAKLIRISVDKISEENAHSSRKAFDTSGSYIGAARSHRK